MTPRRGDPLSSGWHYAVLQITFAFHCPVIDNLPITSELITLDVYDKRSDINLKPEILPYDNAKYFVIIACIIGV